MTDLKDMLASFDALPAEEQAKVLADPKGYKPNMTPITDEDRHFSEMQRILKGDADV